MTCRVHEPHSLTGPFSDTRTWYRPHDFEDIRTASSIGELFTIALRTIRRSDARWPIDILCGPMTTGGFGSLETNLAVFRRSLDLLSQEQGYRPFDQMPFQPALARLAASLPRRNGYCSAILQEFYFPLFEFMAVEGYLRRGIFLPRWATSVGATHERIRLRDLKIALEEYPAALWQRAVRDALPEVTGLTPSSGGT